MAASIVRAGGENLTVERGKCMVIFENQPIDGVRTDDLTINALLCLAEMNECNVTVTFGPRSRLIRKVGHE